MKQLRLILALALMSPLYSNSQTLGNIDEIGPFSEDLAAIRKGDQWGFINKEGTLVIDYRNDLYWNENADSSKSDILGMRYPVFKDGRCIIKQLEGDVPIYGFIDKEGKTIIEPQFLNVTHFENGYTTGVVFEKVFKGENEFKLKIFDFKFHDVLMDTSGKIEEFLAPRYNIQMVKKRYQLPTIDSKLLADRLVAVRNEKNQWEIRKINR
tara:strand:- start:1315 stop:1944 length:630 start_codon:yes stop_codon:yes gene_type:complete